MARKGTIGRAGVDGIQAEGERVHGEGKKRALNGARLKSNERDVVTGPWTHPLSVTLHWQAVLGRVLDPLRVRRKPCCDGSLDIALLPDVCASQAGFLLFLVPLARRRMVLSQASYGAR